MNADAEGLRFNSGFAISYGFAISNFGFET